MLTVSPSNGLGRTGEGRYCEAEINHYREVLACCQANGITPVVTMHHFSSPQWLIKEGGWESEKVVAYFRDYCAYVAAQLGDQMKYICTINEANMRLQMTSVMRTFAKNMGINLQIGVNLELPEQFMVGRREACAAFGGVAAVNTFLDPCTEAGDLLIMQAHEAARDAMKAKCPHLAIGITFHCMTSSRSKAGKRLPGSTGRRNLPIIFRICKRMIFSDCRTTPEAGQC